MSSSSSSFYQKPDVCSCGFSPVLRTSWTDANPGRRFWGCNQYMRYQRRGCNFHVWHDPTVGDREKNIIPGLLKRIQRMEEELKRSKKREMKLKFSLFSALIAVFMLVFVMFSL